MARLARVVVPGVPHHVTQRGNRRQRTFWGGEDYEEYLHLMAEFCQLHGVAIWAYCLMSNHVHLVAVPKQEGSLHRAIGEAHRRYTRYINFKKKWRGYLWQGRFSSYPMDDTHVYEVGRYVENNPVTAKVSRNAWGYRWSSARAHVVGKNDVLVDVEPLRLWVGGDWKAYLKEGIEIEKVRAFERHARTGRPLGDLRFLRRVERKTGRKVIPGKPGRPRIGK